MKKYILLLMLILSGCSCSKPPTPIELPKKVDVFILSDFGSATYGIDLWEKKIIAKYKDPVILACHGVYAYDNWFLVPKDKANLVTVDNAVRTLRLIFPTRPIFLIVCNGHHEHLHIKGVHYSPSFVYVIPDGADIVRPNTYRGEPIIGKLEDFIED